MIFNNINVNIGGDEGKDESSKESIVDNLKLGEHRGMGRQYADLDLDYLIKTHKPDLLGDTVKDAKSIVSLALKLRDREELPHTHAVFGGWGSGKTYLITEVAIQAKEQELKVIYFNAFKYATYMEIVPSLIYRLMRSLEPASGMSKLSDLTEAATKDYNPKLHKAIVSGAHIVRNGASLLSNVQSDRQLEKAAQFYERVDRFHYILATEMKNEKGPILVLIDELDRCDPLEAFDVIKQLRVLFCATGVPLFFVLSANPDPIGRAIQHKYGLGDSDHFETLRILEKFVDSTVSIPRNRQLSAYINDIWYKAGLNLREHAQFLFLGSNTPSILTLSETLCSSPIYANLRLLKKTINRVASTGSQRNAWSRWHFLLITAMFPTLAEQISRYSGDIARIVDQATGFVLTDAEKNGVLKNGSFDWTDRPASWDALGAFERSLRASISIVADSQTASIDKSTKGFLDEMREDPTKFSILLQLCIMGVEPIGNFNPQSSQGAGFSSKYTGGPSAISAFRGVLQSS